MSSTVAIIAITSGATLSAAGITAYASQAQARLRSATEENQMRARFRHERSLHDLDELRSVLDEAADAMRSVGEVVEKRPRPGWTEDALSVIRPLRSRLALRLGFEHGLSVATIAMIMALEEVQHLYARASIKTEEDEENFWIDLEYLQDDASVIADSFLAEAQKTVGAHLAIQDAPI